MRSLNARVTLAAGLVLVVFVALSVLALDRAFRQSARSALHERLLAQVYLLMATAEVDGNGHLTLPTPPPEPRLQLPGSGLYASILDGKGHVVWRSRSALSVPAPSGAPLAAGVRRFGETKDAQGHGYFVQSFGVGWAAGQHVYPFTFTAAEDLTPYRAQLAAYRHSLWGWLGALSLLLLAAQWLTLRWGLAPLRRVADEIGRLERGEQTRMGGDYPTEVQRLTGNINTLIEHERARQKRYRDALADLAHSLKTPLTLLRGAGTGQRDTTDLAHTVDEQVARMQRVVDYHLQRAAASGSGGMPTPQAALPAVERLLRTVQRVHADKEVRCEVTVPADLMLRMDEGDVTEVLGNLLDNAFKWCRQRVRVAASTDANSTQLCIEDDGPGVAPADAQRVLERGIRADENVPGHGIGLAVTRSIMESYGGQVHIARAALGGASVCVVLPHAA